MSALNTEVSTEIKVTVRKLINEYDTVVIYPFGQEGGKVARYIKDNYRKIQLYMADNKKCGKNGIMSPQEVNEALSGTNYAVLFTVENKYIHKELIGNLETLFNTGVCFDLYAYDSIIDKAARETISDILWNKEARNLLVCSDVISGEAITRFIKDKDEDVSLHFIESSEVECYSASDIMQEREKWKNQKDFLCLINVKDRRKRECMSILHEIYKREKCIDLDATSGSWNPRFGIQHYGYYEEHERISLQQPFLTTSMICNQWFLDTPTAQYWADKLKMRLTYHRKAWELVYICQTLWERGLLNEGKKGVVFGDRKSVV